MGIRKTDLDQFAKVSKEVLVIIESVAKQLLPFIPESAQKILDAVTLEKIVKAEPLFPRID